MWSEDLEGGSERLMKIICTSEEKKDLMRCITDLDAPCMFGLKCCNDDEICEDCIEKRIDWDIKED